MQGGGGQTGGVALVAEDDDLKVVPVRLGQPVTALRVEPPLQLVPLDDQGPRDQTVPFAEGGVADVHQERPPTGGVPRLLRGEPGKAGADAFQVGV